MQRRRAAAAGRGGDGRGGVGATGGRPCVRADDDDAQDRPARVGYDKSCPYGCPSLGVAAMGGAEQNR
ncbi:hypothetical protein, partial [Rubrivirga litoralis]